MARTLRTTLFSIAALAAFAGVAEAHPGHSASGLAAGFAHPFSGLDHMLAMVAVGLFAARLGGRALWLVPSAFVAMMVAGGALGMAGIALPQVELLIATSVIILGAAAALDFSIPVALAAGLVGFFAVFHGHAHGAEMPASATGFAFAAGFVGATGLLHGLGLGLGLASLRASSQVAKLAGAATAVAGLGLLFGAL